VDASVELVDLDADDVLAAGAAQAGTAVDTAALAGPWVDALRLLVRSARDEGGLTEAAGQRFDVRCES
jgi:hypothetical protein